MKATVIKCALYMVLALVSWSVCSGASHNGHAELLTRGCYTSESDTLVIRKVKIVHYKKIVDRDANSFERDEARCARWTLSKSQLEWIILHSRKIDGHEFSYYFSVFPCYYKGVVIINDKITLEFKVNAGSFAVLYDSNTSIRLGYYGKQKLFLQTPGIE